MASPLRRLLPYHERYKAAFWSGMAVLILARVFEGIIPLFLKLGIDRISATGQAVDAGTTTLESAQMALALPALAIGACVLARFVCVVVSRRIIRRIGVYVAYDLRKRVYAHLQRQGPSFFARFPTGDLMARAINDINLIRQLISQGLRTLLVMIAAAIIGLVCMASLSWQLTLLLLLPAPAIAVFGWITAGRVFERSVRVQEGFSTMSERVQENLNGIRTVQALVQEEHEIARFQRVNEDYAERFFALTRLNSFIRGVMPWLGAFSTAIILGYGGSQVLAGEITIGSFAAFFSYATMVLWPVREAGQVVTLWQQGASGTGRLFEILDAEPEIADRPDPAAPAHVRGALNWRSLDYRYPGAAGNALTGIDLSIAPGETIAVLGRVGSGKTTLLKCCVRLIDPPPGQLLIDGFDVRAYPLAQLRHQVVLVPQDPFLFADVLRNNLSYDDPDREDGLIWQAAEDADLKDTILALADELTTLVGERGVTLSGGQKQRSALSRGLIRSAGVLLLDDCFSSVDTQTEEHILGRLFEARRGKTTILVSHRVSTARHADRIVVLDDGRISELGSHRELLDRGGWYAELERAQGSRGRLLAQLEEES